MDLKLSQCYKSLPVDFRRSTMKQYFVVWPILRQVEFICRGRKTHGKARKIFESQLITNSMDLKLSQCYKSLIVDFRRSTMKQYFVVWPILRQVEFICRGRKTHGKARTIVES